jgi:hypothetical protein
MVAPPAVSHAKARTLPVGKGKEVAEAGSVAEGVAHALQQAAMSVPEGICAKAGVYDLLCFCCPMPDTDTYRKRYVLEEGTDNITSSLGRSIIDLHSEFVAWKAAQESAIRAAQLSHNKIFHQDEELAAIIAQCEHRNSDLLLYGPREDPADDWLRNMPLEEQIGEAAPGRDAVETADAEMQEWSAVKASAVSRPSAGPSVLHTMMVPSGRPVNLGWSGANRFSTLAGPQGSDTPSKVADNA